MKRISDKERLNFCCQEPLIAFIIFGRLSILNSGRKAIISSGILNGIKNPRQAIDAVIHAGIEK